MRPSSAKAKGRRLVAKIRDMLLAWAPDLPEQDIIIMPTAVSGKDLRMSGRAEELYPFAVEAKNCEKLNVWEAIKQCEGYRTEKLTPLLVIARNNHEPYAVIKLDEFLRLIR